MSQPMNGSFGLAMFRKKKVEFKPGCRIIPIKENGELLYSLLYLWTDILWRANLDTLDIVGGPAILMRMQNYLVPFGMFKRYVLEHPNVSIWVPEDYQYV